MITGSGTIRKARVAAALTVTAACVATLTACGGSDGSDAGNSGPLGGGAVSQNAASDGPSESGNVAAGPQKSGVDSWQGKTVHVDASDEFGGGYTGDFTLPTVSITVGVDKKGSQIVHTYRLTAGAQASETPRIGPFPPKPTEDGSAKPLHPSYYAIRKIPAGVIDLDNTQFAPTEGTNCGGTTTDSGPTVDSWPGTMWCEMKAGGTADGPTSSDLGPEVEPEQADEIAQQLNQPPVGFQLYLDANGDLPTCEVDLVPDGSYIVTESVGNFCGLTDVRLTVK